MIKQKNQSIMEIKNYFRKASLMLALSLPLVFVSCDKDEEPAPQQDSIVDVVVKGNNFTLLEAAVKKAGYVDLLTNTNNLTVFAPNDDAFRQLDVTGDGTPDLDTEAKINAITAGPVLDLLKAVLNYHVVASRVPSSAITTAGISADTYGPTAAGPKLFAKINGGNAFINGIQVVTADVAARNGIIHVINKVLVPPSATITGVVAGNPNFSRLLYAINRVKNNGGADIAAALNGAGPFTVFAPSNAAFTASGFATDASLDAVPVADLQSILLHHAVGARVFSSDLTAGDVSTLLTATAATKKITINLTGPAVYGAGNGATAANWPKVIATNVMANNGVIHVIDRVILP
jgi:uncharacterized surface protein with fasciclin (FAS1) repeats